jgi:hypothetical protein
MNLMEMDLACRHIVEEKVSLTPVLRPFPALSPAVA